MSEVEDETKSVKDPVIDRKAENEKKMEQVPEKFKDGFKKILKKKTVGSHDTHADQYVKETIEDEPLTANIPAHLLPSSIEDPKHVVFGGEDKGKICFLTHNNMC